MSINLEFIDIQSLSIIQDSISEITDLSFSTYDSSGVLLIPSKSEDSLVAKLKAYASGREKYEKFIQSGIEKAAIRKDVFLLKGPLNEHHLFIPISANDYKFVLASGPFSLLRTEFEESLTKKGQYIGILPSRIDLGSEIIKTTDYPSIHKTAVNIKSICETVLRSGYERNLNYKRYQWSKTLMDVLFNIPLPAPIEDVHSLILDALLFIFNVESASIMVKEKNLFKTAVSSGKIRDDIKSICLEKSIPLISQAIENYMPGSTNNIMEISKLGFPNSITSIHIFPLVCKNSTHGVIVIYNSTISREASYSILEFCKLACLVLKSLSLQTAYNKCIDDMTMVNIAAAKLTPQLYNPDALYEAIVNTAIEILRAEKGSIMLPEGDNLLIKAVRGINRWLTQDIRVKIGEGIAGRVFKEGMPLLSNNGRAEKVLIKHRSHYKTTSFVSVPLKFASETIGVLNIADKITGEVFTEGDLNLVNHFASYVSIALKVSSYYNLAEQMKELSITDPLTGIFNRRYLQERFAEEIHRSERYEFVFSLAMLDIDDFKIFNDSEGHLAGDNVLKDVARIARDCLRANDIISRFGGEEFAVLMPQTNKKEAFAVAERIRENIKASLCGKWEKFPHPCITVSIGMASFPNDGASANELIKNADTALYKAKSSGKNKTVIYESI